MRTNSRPPTAVAFAGRPRAKTAALPVNFPAPLLKSKIEGEGKANRRRDFLRVGRKRKKN